MRESYLEFEKPIVALEEKLLELRQLSHESKHELAGEIGQIHRRVKVLLNETFKDLSPWQVTLLSRHPQRPHMKDYLPLLFEDFVELHGDRGFREDPAIISGLAKFEGQSVVVVGNQKGRSTREKVERNFGMPKPEGYRKALRIFRLAERFGFPVITLIDTPGAYPGVGAEERGQSEAIANNLLVMSGLKTPIISVVLGEGGSGGALAIGVADRLLMLEYSIYSVISPEGCAAILWGDQQFAQTASRALHLTSEQLLALGIADEVIREPLGGAHRDLPQTARKMKRVISTQLNALKNIPLDELIKQRHEKFRRIGVWRES